MRADDQVLSQLVGTVTIDSFDGKTASLADRGAIHKPDLDCLSKHVFFFLNSTCHFQLLNIGSMLRFYLMTITV